MTLTIILGGEDILTRQNDGDDFDDLNNTLKKDYITEYTWNLMKDKGRYHRVGG